MRKLGKSYGQAGSVASIVAIVLLVTALLGTAAFAFSASSSKQDYKNNSDQKASAAVSAALADQKIKLQNQFAEQAKSPTLTYTGPATYGTITFNYARTWNGYIDTTDATNPLKGLFYVGVVPAGASAYSLKIQLLDADYVSTINSFNDLVTSGALKATAYVPPKMVGVTNVQTGTRFDGQVENDPQGNPVQGSVVVLKVRDKTLELFAELPSSLNDFNNTILSSLTYVP